MHIIEKYNYADDNTVDVAEKVSDCFPKLLNFEGLVKRKHSWKVCYGILVIFVSKDVFGVGHIEKFKHQNCVGI